MLKTKNKQTIMHGEVLGAGLSGKVKLAVSRQSGDMFALKARGSENNITI